MVTYVNSHNGHRRKLGKFTPFLGALFFGPVYFLAKGVWPAFLIMATVYAPLVQVWPFLLFIQLIVAFFAAVIVRRHHISRGFMPEVIA
ncbi:hypothetical protein [Rhizobium sp. IBUN]|uniref:hypothetical protein n=1 Tax=Rhizobium sp. IBUN TaxID=1042326 RepID=UPI000416B2FC|nr:hypothetical protein [Rhizobium sp. IBUN]